MTLRRRHVVVLAGLAFCILSTELPSRGQGAQLLSVDAPFLIDFRSGSRRNMENEIDVDLTFGPNYVKESLKIEVSSGDVKVSAGNKPGSVNIAFKYRDILTGAERNLFFAMNVAAQQAAVVASTSSTSLSEPTIQFGPRRQHWWPIRVFDTPMKQPVQAAEVSSTNIRLSSGLKMGSVELQLKFQDAATGEERTLLYLVNPRTALPPAPTERDVKGDNGSGGGSGSGY